MDSFNFKKKLLVVYKTLFLVFLSYPKLFTIFNLIGWLWFIKKYNMTLKRNKLLNLSTSLLEVFYNIAEQRFWKCSNTSVLILQTIFCLDSVFLVVCISVSSHKIVNAWLYAQAVLCVYLCLRVGGRGGGAWI